MKRRFTPEQVKDMPRDAFVVGDAVLTLFQVLCEPPVGLTGIMILAATMTEMSESEARNHFDLDPAQLATVRAALDVLNEAYGPKDV